MQANISLIRGDTLPLSIDSIAIQGTEEKYILAKSDVIYMDIKRHDYDKDAVVTKTLTAEDYDSEGKLNFIILPSDTENLPCGEYVYDVRLYQDEDNIYTIIPYSKFTILKNITDIPDMEVGE